MDIAMLRSVDPSLAATRLCRIFFLRLTLFVIASAGGFPIVSSKTIAQSTFNDLPLLPAIPAAATAGPLSITRQAVPSKPFSVVGPRGAVLGQQDGSFELWTFPYKVLSNLRISALVDQYPVPIDVNQHAAVITSNPDSTIITFSHANFTVREIVVAPKSLSDGSGTLIFFQIEAIRPTTFTFSFTPNMQRMWPAQSDDMPAPEWIASKPSSGFYILHLNFPDTAAAIAMPTAEPGIIQPYQELAASYPLQFVVHFDPARDTDKIYPLLTTISQRLETSTKDSFATQLADLDRASESIFNQNQTYYCDLLQSEMHLETPDTRLNLAFSRAESSIDQLRVETSPEHHEEALVAGFIGSGASVRPGFGWFFGRDALWTIYALDSAGNYEPTRQELEFLLRHQSPEGKIPHEWSQTSDLVDWKLLPYEYASADATALLPMAMNDYLRVSGDIQFVAKNWDALTRAWHFETTHDADGDGIYDNSEGSAWVESWIPSMPKQEIYLALLDEQASLAFANLAHSTGHSDLESSARTRATKIAHTIEKEYFLPKSNDYAFSWNDNKPDTTATIFPAVAWWDGDTQLDHKDLMISHWASSDFSTDWGTRPVSDRTSFYDPISYHQGTVWPLFTGWASVAEYRTGHALSAYDHLMQNVDLTFTQDLGNVTELLSGRFFQPLGRSTAHQLWSSAMVISPVVHGLLGLDWNVPENTLTVSPHIPADWSGAIVRNVPFGKTHLDIKITRTSTQLDVEAINAPSTLLLRSHLPDAQIAGHIIHIPLPPVEIAIIHQAPEFGAETSQLKVIDQQNAPHTCTLSLEGRGGATYTLLLRENASSLDVHSQDATIGPLDRGLRTVTVTFPSAPAYIKKVVTFSW
jgi:glycogen debranching enzyme